jgi:two-component system CheB/CheR fusion protein
MLRALLEMRGHRVRVANSGPEGLELLRAEHADVVVCDIGLPGMTGYEFAEHVRRDPQLRLLQMIALSGYGQPDDRRRSQAAGFDHHLVKPVDPTTLDAVIGGELRT